MSSAYISAQLRQHVAERAGFRCEYCQTQERIIGMPLEVEHIIPKADGGETDEENLCLACPRCNRHKGRQTEATDRITGDPVALYHPRRQHWHEHFAWQENGIVILKSRPPNSPPCKMPSAYGGSPG